MSTPTIATNIAMRRLLGDPSLANHISRMVSRDENEQLTAHLTAFAEYDDEPSLLVDSYLWRLYFASQNYHTFQSCCANMKRWARDIQIPPAVAEEMRRILSVYEHPCIGMQSIIIWLEATMISYEETLFAEMAYCRAACKNVDYDPKPGKDLITALKVFEVHYIKFAIIACERGAMNCTDFIMRAKMRLEEIKADFNN